MGAGAIGECSAARGGLRGVFSPRALPGRFVRYSLASASGTVIDLSVLGLLVWSGISVWLAAGAGYALGTVWHWQISSRLVFADRLAPAREGRRRQQALFVISALLGLVCTTAIVALATAQGMPVVIAKAAAMGAAFMSVWLVRLMFVFGEIQGFREIEG